MPVMNFDLEDGLPPVSFSLKTKDCERFMEFMAECQAVKDQPQRKPLTDAQIDSFREANSEGRGAGWRFNFKGFARAIEAAHGIYAPSERRPTDFKE